MKKQYELPLIRVKETVNDVICASLDVSNGDHLTKWMWDEEENNDDD